MPGSRIAACAALLLFGCASPPPKPTSAAALTNQAHSYLVIDLTPPFWQFWSAAHGQPPALQARLFYDALVTRHPEVYTASVLGLDAGKPLVEEIEKRYARWLPMLLPQMDQMRRVSAQIADDLPRYESSSRAAFPDMNYDGEVYFLNSLGAFDGATRTVKDRTALLFGVDMIAFVNREQADPQPFFHHELFHIYHAQVAPQRDDDRLYQELWSEGLALHVAKTLNPSAGGVMLFGLPPDMPERAQKVLPQQARELRESLDSSSRETYARYFYGRGEQGDVPPRSGYYVGYLVAQRIGGTTSLQALARMQGRR